MPRELSEKERRDIEEQTALLWVANHPNTRKADFGYGYYARIGIEMEWVNVLRRLEAKGMVTVEYFVRGWFSQKLYSVNPLTPEQIVLKRLMENSPLTVYEMAQGTGVDGVVLLKAVERLHKEKRLHPVLKNDGRRVVCAWEIVELPF